MVRKMADDKKTTETKTRDEERRETIRKVADAEPKARTQQQADAQKRKPETEAEMKAKVAAANPEIIDPAPESKADRDAAASEASLNAQVRHTRSAEEVGNEFVPQDQGKPISVAETPKAAADDSEVKPRRTASSDNDAQSSGPATRDYVVGDRGIHTSEGKKKPGERVALTAAEARAFNKQKAILPYIPDEGEE